MKFLLVLAALACVAYAELEVFVGDKEIKFDEETLKKIDITHITVKKGNDEIPDLELPEGKSLIDDKITAYLQSLIDQVDQGWPESGIPPLDPFHLDLYETTIKQPFLFKATIGLTNIDVTGLKKLIIENIDFNVLRLSFNCAFDLPELRYDSGFDVNGKITLVIPFHFGGGFRAKFTHFKLTGKMALGTTPDGYLTLKTMELTMSVDKTSIHFDGIIGSGPLNEIANWILNLFTNGFLQSQIENAGTALSEILYQTINEALGKISLADLIG